MRQTNIELQIQELFIEDPGSVDSNKVSPALQQELTSLLRGKLRYGQSAVANRTVESIEVDSNRSGTDLGAEVAQAIFRELQK